LLFGAHTSDDHWHTKTELLMRTDERNALGRTALMLAARAGHMVVCRMLLENFEVGRAVVSRIENVQRGSHHRGSYVAGKFRGSPRALI
jgi:ankyrin repeat protein